jgi:hypothetical protein
MERTCEFSTHPFCTRSCEEGQRYCKKHKCKKCNEMISTTTAIYNKHQIISEYCSKHKCKRRCGNERLNNSEYCIKHSLPEESYGYGYCPCCESKAKMKNARKMIGFIISPDSYPKYQHLYFCRIHENLRGGTLEEQVSKILYFKEYLKNDKNRINGSMLKDRKGRLVYVDEYRNFYAVENENYYNPKKISVDEIYEKEVYFKEFEKNASKILYQDIIEIIKDYYYN